MVPTRIVVPTHHKFFRLRDNWQSYNRYVLQAKRDGLFPTCVRYSILTLFYLICFNLFSSFTKIYAYVLHNTSSGLLFPPLTCNFLQTGSDWQLKNWPTMKRRVVKNLVVSPWRLSSTFFIQVSVGNSLSLQASVLPKPVQPRFTPLLFMTSFIEIGYYRVYLYTKGSPQLGFDFRTSVGSHMYGHMSILLSIFLYMTYWRISVHTTDSLSLWIQYCSR